MPIFSQTAHHDELAPSLELVHVSVSYDGIPALDDVSFTVHRGDQVAVVGPNGAGKSTLFNVIAGIVKPQRGEVRVYGSGPQRHICVGYVPQRNRIDWRFPVSVNDTVMMGRIGKMGMFRWPSRADRRIVTAALERVGMQAYAEPADRRAFRRAATARLPGQGAGAGVRVASAGRTARRPGHAVAGGVSGLLERSAGQWHHHAHRHPRPEPGRPAIPAASCC